MKTLKSAETYTHTHTHTHTGSSLKVKNQIGTIWLSTNFNTVECIMRSTVFAF